MRRFTRYLSTARFPFWQQANTVVNSPFSELSKKLSEHIPPEKLPGIYSLIYQCTEEMRTNPNTHFQWVENLACQFSKPMDILLNLIRENQFTHAMKLLKEMQKLKHPDLNAIMLEELSLRMQTKLYKQDDDAETTEIKTMIRQLIDNMKDTKITKFSKLQKVKL